jgi:phage tail-like protein
MTTIKLPGFWFDHLQSQATVGIVVANEYPEPNDVDFPRASPLTLEILSTHTSGVDLSDTTIYIDGVAALLNGVFQTGYVTGSSATPINVHDYRFVVGHDVDFASGATVTVRVVSETIDAAYTVDTTYTFTVEDYVAPRVLSAAAVFADRVRVTFDEAMLASSASNANDGLNPANYALAYQQSDPSVAAVSATVVSVAAISSTVLEITTDIPLTFSRVYRVTCGDIADDSTNANLLDAAYRTADFTSWFPTSWPDGRRFDIWTHMLSDHDREGDIHDDLKKLVSVWQDTLDLRLWDIDRFEQIWDIDRATMVFIRAMLQDLGNPFKIDVGDNRLRKLVDQLVASYGQKGTDRAIVNLARFFLGLDVTVTAHNSNEEVWTLEEVSDLDVSGAVGGLSVDTIIGPAAGTPELYTFIVQSGIVLTAEQRLNLGQIIEIVKVAHEHYAIIDPSDTPEYDPWEIGLSYLGEDTFVHE